LEVVVCGAGEATVKPFDVQVMTATLVIGSSLVVKWRYPPVERNPSTETEASSVYFLR
jgi:hypothetical protein